MKIDKKLQIIDADWASAEHSVIMFSDHSIRIFDLKLTKSYSSIYNYEFDGETLLCIVVYKVKLFYLYIIVNDNFYILDLQGPPTILDSDLCKMFYFWLSATCKKVYSTELGFNNYELSRK